MKKLFFILALICACVCTSYAQDYKSAIGLRLGYPASISFKQFLSEKNAIEIFLGYRRYSGFLNFINVGGLYQVHNNIADVPGLKWYYGGGVSVFFWNYDNDFYFNNNYNNLNLGIMGNLGLDYKFTDIPLNLSVDWVPTFVIGEALYGGFGAGWGALSARYTLR